MFLDVYLIEEDRIYFKFSFGGSIIQSSVPISGTSETFRHVEAKRLNKGVKNMLAEFEYHALAAAIEEQWINKQL